MPGDLMADFRLCMCDACIKGRVASSYGYHTCDWCGHSTPNVPAVDHWCMPLEFRCDSCNLPLGSMGLCDVCDETEEQQESCLQPGSAGVHSDSYGDDGDGACEWCGARPHHGGIKR